MSQQTDFMSPTAWGNEDNGFCHEVRSALSHMTEIRNVETARKNLKNFKAVQIQNVECVYLALDASGLGRDQTARPSESTLRDIVSDALRPAIKRASSGNWDIVHVEKLGPEFGQRLNFAYVIVRAGVNRTVIRALEEGDRKKNRLRATRPSLLDRILKDREIVFGCANWPRMASWDPITGADGLYMKLVDAIVRKHGLTAKFEKDVVHNWIRDPSNVDDISMMQVDAVVGMIETPRRRLAADFVGQSHLVNIVGVKRRGDDHIQGIDDLLGGKIDPDRIAVVKGEAGHEFLEDVLHLRAKVILADHNALTLLRAVKAGVYDFVLTNAVIVSVQFESAKLRMDPLDELEIQFDCLAVQPVGFMIPKGDDKFGEWLHREVQEALNDAVFLQAQKKLLGTLERQGWPHLLQPFSRKPLPST